MWRVLALIFLTGLTLISPFFCLAGQTIEVEPPLYLSYFEPPLYLLAEYEEVVEQEREFILAAQLSSGDIPLVLTTETEMGWYKVWGIEPWDHTYCAIALDLVGEHERARLAYEWLLSTQNDDGSWDIQVISISMMEQQGG